MRDMKVGQDVALSAGYGRAKLGEIYSSITRAKVVAVDPVCRVVERPYRGKAPEGCIFTDHGRGGFTTRNTDYFLDPNGTPLKGYVLLQYKPVLWGEEGTLITQCFKKAKVIGDWDEHVKLKTANEVKERRAALLASTRKHWDTKAMKAIKDILAELPGYVLDNGDGRVSIDIEMLAKALGLQLGSRP